MRGAAAPSKAKLTYFQDKSLTLELQYKSADSWTQCFSLTPTDTQPLRLPNTAYLGFSAHTGELSDNFDIIRVETRNLYNPVASNTGRNVAGPRSGRARSEKKSGGWGRFLVKIILVGFVAGGGYIGYKKYKENKRYSSF